MCVFSLKNTFLAIKSTVKVGHCSLWAHKNVNQHIKFVTVEKQPTLMSLWPILNWFQIIYQTGPSYTCHFHNSLLLSLMYAEHGGMFPPSGLKARDMMLDWWYLGVGFYWFMLRRRRRWNCKPQIIYLNKPCLPGMAYWRQCCQKKGYNLFSPLKNLPTSK